MVFFLSTLWRKMMSVEACACGADCRCGDACACSSDSKCSPSCVCE